MLEIERVTKEYRSGVRANDEVSLRVAAGEVVGLLGPNGAGKTTLVRQIVGLARPTSGSIVIDGVDVVRHPESARASCCWQPQTQAPIRGLSPVQAISLVAELRGAPRRAARARAEELIDALAIDEWSKALGFQLSGGVARLVAFAMAAAVPGKVVILDEPTNDVDPLRRRLLWRQVRDLAERGAAVLLVTHNVLEAERAVDHLALMDAGRVVAAGTPGSLKPGASAGFRLELLVEPGSSQGLLPEFVRNPVTTGRRVLADLHDGDLEAAVAWARAERRQGRVEEFSIGPTTLEDVYVRLVEQDESEEVSA
ncbi:MAG TPA: ABC transporter ATP-binding protein [Acidimicrobiales bacterium]|nr:ABC transporter ATP-binding protein [Acidimicrobiales bacterium]